MRQGAVLALALIGCGTTVAGSPVPAPAPRPAHRYQELAAAEVSGPLPSEAVIDARAVDADLALLEYALDRGYAGRPVVPVVAYQAMLQKLAALRGAPRAVGAFCEAVGDALWELPDAHLVHDFAGRFFVVRI